MTNAQRIIKYCAIALAILIIATLVGSIVQVIRFFASGENEKELLQAPIELALEEDGSELDSIRIDLAATKLTVCRGDALKIVTNDPSITAVLEKGKLTLQEPKRKTSFWGIQIGSVNSKVGELTLTLPEVLFEELELSAGVGEVQIDVLAAKKAKLDLGVGDVIINKLSVTESGEIDCGVGDLMVKSGALHGLSMDIGIGETKISAVLTGKTEIDLGIGNAEFTVRGSSEDYTVTVEKGIGSAKIDGKSVKDGQTYGDGANRIVIDGGIGSIELEFIEDESKE
ncbi:MAG: DUF4097 family beta strand repeat protein [Clostridia bacterium]|nr:DUF4097 family beta strand repeat protein [Clostridia bacterium]